MSRTILKTALKQKDFNSFQNALPNNEYKICYVDEKSDKLILESKGIGLFHWGFLFFVTQNEEAYDIGIYAKGPNPPKQKALEKHLDVFIKKLKALI